MIGNVCAGLFVLNGHATTCDSCTEKTHRKVFLPRCCKCEEKHGAPELTPSQLAMKKTFETKLEERREARREAQEIEAKRVWDAAAPARAEVERARVARALARKELLAARKAKLCFSY